MPSKSNNPIRPSSSPTYEDKPPPPTATIFQETEMPTLRPTFSRNNCKAMASDVSRGFNYSLSFEIVAPSTKVSYMKFGELYTDCAPPISELLVRYNANLKGIVQVDSIQEDVTSTNCQTNLDCTTLLQGGGAAVCIAGKCVNAGKPLFALIWKGNDNYKLRVRAPNGSVFVAGKGILSIYNVKIITFPLSGGPNGKYFLDVRIPKTSQNTMLNSWSLVTFPGTNTDTNNNGLTIIQNGTGNRANMNFVYTITPGKK
jgi:hypothetical protein